MKFKLVFKSVKKNGKKEGIGIKKKNIKIYPTFIRITKAHL